MKYQELMTEVEITTEEGILVVCRFRNLCDKKWGDLREIAGERQVRYCNECMQPVFLCRTRDELTKHARASHCISIHCDSSDGVTTGFIVV